MTDSRKTNVLLWVPRYWPAMGGTELHTRELANALSSSHQVKVITHCTASETSEVSLEQDVNSSLDSIDTDGSVTVQRLCIGNPEKPASKMLAGQYRRFKIARVIYSIVFFSSLYRRSIKSAENTDLIHFVYNGLTDSAMLAAAVAKRCNIPFVFTPNILDTSDQKHAWNSTRFKHLYKSASRIIALTPHEAEWLVKQNIPRDKISIIPYGPILHGRPDGLRFRRMSKTGDAKIVLFLSRIIPLKGYELVLDACNQIWKSHPDTRIVFMGPATPESRNSILRSGDSRIVLLEEFDQNTKADALAACDLLCVPSRKESLGVVYIEAAFNAKPVIALKLPVLHEVIEHGKDGLLVEDSALSVAEAVNSLLDCPSKSINMGLCGQAKAMEKFNWINVTIKISHIYRDVIAERLSQPAPILFPTFTRFARILSTGNPK